MNSKSRIVASLCFVTMSFLAKVVVGLDSQISLEKITSVMLFVTGLWLVAEIVMNYSFDSILGNVITNYGLLIIVSFIAAIVTNLAGYTNTTRCLNECGATAIVLMLVLMLVSDLTSETT